MNRFDLTGRTANSKLNTKGTIFAFSIATTRDVRQTDGSYTETTDWHRVKVFGAKAQRLSANLGRGRLVQVAGHIEPRKWTDDEGKDHYEVDLVASNVAFLSKRSDA